MDYSNILLLLRTIRARAQEALALHKIARSIRQVVAGYLLLVSHAVDATYIFAFCHQLPFQVMLS